LVSCSNFILVEYVGSFDGKHLFRVEIPVVHAIGSVSKAFLEWISCIIASSMLGTPLDSQVPRTLSWNKILFPVPIR
jgi:hypothetical protein